MLSIQQNMVCDFCASYSLCEVQQHNTSVHEPRKLSGPEAPTANNNLDQGDSPLGHPRTRISHQLDFVGGSQTSFVTHLKHSISL